MLWTPTQKDDEEVELVDPHLAMGNGSADALATVAAEMSWDRVARPLPQTDEWDVITSLVRQRTRRALQDAAGEDP